MRRKFSAKKSIYFSLIIILCVLVVLSLRPLPAATLNNCESYNGLITEVREGNGGDIVIKMENDKGYYINRGTERGLSIADLENKLKNKQAEILTINRWSLLNISGRTNHISRIRLGDNIIFSEINPNN